MKSSMALSLLATVLLCACARSSYTSDASVFSSITVLVSKNGTDDTNCLTGSPTRCLTLNYVLNNLGDVNSTNISVLVDYNYTSYFNPVNISVSVSVNIRGLGMLTVGCLPGTGIMLYASTIVKLEISSIIFVGCGTASNSSVGFLFQSFERLRFKDCQFVNSSDLVIRNTLRVEVDQCEFVCNKSFETALQFVFDDSWDCAADNGSQYHVSVTRSNFYNTVVKSTKKYGQRKASIRGSSIQNSNKSGSELYFWLLSCNFWGSNDLDSGNSALRFSVTGYTHNITLTVEQCIVTGMNGRNALFKVIISGGQDGHMSMKFNDNQVINNSFKHLGSLMSFYITTEADTQGSFNISLTNNTIARNTNCIGLSLIVKKLAFPAAVNLTVSDSIYCDNQGRVMRVSCTNCQGNELTNVYITEVEFLNNTNKLPTKSPADIVVLDHCKVVICNISFIGNIGTPVYFGSVVIQIHGRLIFDGNVGAKGGACRFGENAKLKAPSKNETVSIELRNNVALYGGAVYLIRLAILDIPLLQLTRECFQAGVSIITENKVEVCKFVLFFDNNMATISGKNVFIDNPFIAFLPCNDSSPCNTTIAGVATSANSIEIHDTDGNNSITVFPGQNIFINSVVKDILGNDATCEAAVFLQCGTDILVCESGNDMIQLSGTGEITLTNTPSISVLQITSENRNVTSNPTLVFQCTYTSKSVPLNIVSCPLGFVFNSNSRKCQCALNNTDKFLCSLEEGLACVAQNYWFGNISEGSDNTSTPILSPCTFPHCSTHFNQCTLKNASLSQTNYILLPLMPDEQCTGTRGGILCLECEVNSSLSFEATLCVPMCQPWQPFVLIVFAVSFQLVLSFVLMYFVRFTKELGILYGPLLFIAMLNNIPFHYHVSFSQLQIFRSIFSSTLLLNLAAFGQIPWCFYLPSLLSFTFQYLGPIISALVLLFNFICARKYPHLLKRLNIPPLQTICFLTLLSFWTIADTSISILQGVRLSGTTRVLIQPSLIYFTSYHVPLVIISVLLLVFLIIPFIGVLLLAQILGKKFNMIHIQPFLDVFQSSFKDNFRYYPGILFLSWVLLLAANQFALISQTIVIAMTMLQFILSPFKSNHLNVMNSFLLLDIILINLFLNQKDVTTTYLINQERQVAVVVFVYVLTLAPLLYFVLAMGFIVLQRHGYIEKWKSLLKKNNRSNGKVDNEELLGDDEININVRSLQVSFHSGFRESLLESIH